MYIQLAPIKLKKGIDEQTLVQASDAFQLEFVTKQKGILQRIVLKGKDGTYADLVFFENKGAADEVAAAEQTSPACLTFFGLMEMDESLPDMGVLSFEHLKTYDDSETL